MKRQEAVEAASMDVEGSVGLASNTAVACLLLGDLQC